MPGISEISQKFQLLEESYKNIFRNTWLYQDKSHNIELYVKIANGVCDDGKDGWYFVDAKDENPVKYKQLTKLVRAACGENADKSMRVRYDYLLIQTKSGDYKSFTSLLAAVDPKKSGEEPRKRKRSKTEEKGEGPEPIAEPPAKKAKSKKSKSKKVEEPGRIGEFNENLGDLGVGMFACPAVLKGQSDRMREKHNAFFDVNKKLVSSSKEFLSSWGKNIEAQMFFNQDIKDFAMTAVGNIVRIDNEMRAMRTRMESMEKALAKKDASFGTQRKQEPGEPWTNTVSHSEPKPKRKTKPKPKPQIVKDDSDFSSNRSSDDTPAPTAPVTGKRATRLRTPGTLVETPDAEQDLHPEESDDSDVKSDELESSPENTLAYSASHPDEDGLEEDEEGYSPEFQAAKPVKNATRRLQLQPVKGKKEHAEAGLADADMPDVLRQVPPEQSKKTEFTKFEAKSKPVAKTGVQTNQGVKTVPLAVANKLQKPKPQKPAPQPKASVESKPDHEDAKTKYHDAVSKERMVASLTKELETIQKGSGLRIDADFDNPEEYEFEDEDLCDLN